jgi:hypothetical protein
MSNDLLLRRKWTLRAHGRQVVFVKRPNEHAHHVLMKALLWALYLPSYPELLVEVPVGDRYKPDVVALDAGGQPRFWGEAGQVAEAKIYALARGYRATHPAIAKWNTRLDPLAATVRDALAQTQRTAPFDLLCFPPDSATRFVDARGAIDVSFDELDWLRIAP